MIMNPVRHIPLARLVLLLLLTSGTWDAHVRAQETRGAAGPSAAADRLDRTVLPIQESSSPSITELDARKATALPRFEVKAPQGVPNLAQGGKTV
jgi:hypothetical protein